MKAWARSIDDADAGDRYGEGEARRVNDKTVIIVGDGPTGLSAALLLAKNGFDVHVLGTDTTPVRKAMLHNYLGDEMPGPEFMEKAREQATRYGAQLHHVRVERIELGEPFRVTTEGGTFEGRYLVLATGFEQGPARELGLAKGEQGLAVDINGRTSHERVYAGGSIVRGMKSQVATGVGDGAAIAVDILSLVRGKPSHDYDVVKPSPQRQPAT